MATQGSYTTQNPSVSLAVNVWSPAVSPLNFQNQICIGKFRTTKEKTYSSVGAVVPTIIPAAKIDKLRGTYLGNDRQRAQLIPQYRVYHDLKQDFFLHWILDNNFFEEVRKGRYKKPEFICFGSCIYFPMMTPGVTRFGDWECYAVQVDGIIYLWIDKLSGDQFDPSKSMESYYGVYFEHLLTHQNPSTCIPNEYEKVFAVNEIKFGSHQLLCLSEIDAQDERGQWVEIKVYKRCSPKGVEFKYLKFWAQSVVSGVRHLIVGERDGEGYLSSVEAITTEEIGRRFSWRPGPCLEFQNRLLDWMKIHFQDRNCRKVIKFSWKAGDSHVYASNVPEEDIPSQLLPMWYVERLQI